MPRAASNQNRNARAPVGFASGDGQARSAAEAEAVRARARGVSFVGGREINIRELLRGFWPSEDVPSDVKRIENVMPFIRPFGCGPMAPQEWLVLRTYARIVEVRDEIRMDDTGMAVGDRTFKRCYQTALEDVKSISAGDTKRRGEAIHQAFLPVQDKLWHRYLFPFGTYAVKVSQSNNKPESDVKETMLVSRDKRSMMNPFSVAAADILYLCNTAGYLSRFLYIIGVIIWAKNNGCNLLHHHRQKKRAGSSKLDEYFSLEKHLHFFGSIYLHINVMECNQGQVGGNWNETVTELKRLYQAAASEFGMNLGRFEEQVRDLTIRSVVGSFSAVTAFFSKANRVQETGTR